MPQDASGQKGDGHPLLKAVLTAALLLLIAMAACLTAYVISAASNSDPFTEFYILDSNGTANNYPRELIMYEPQPVIVGVVNHEHRAMDYDLAITLENATSSYKLYEEHIQLADKGNWTRPVNITPPISGTRMKVSFNLYANGDMSVPYRNCYLYVNVTRAVAPGL
jgi:uncharacterized membrane protein